MEELDFDGEDGDIDAILETCRPDVVIVVVYPQQKINVPFATIEEMGPPELGELTRKIALKLFKNHGLKVEPAPVTNPTSYNITGLGHAGICVIDGKQEKAYYYEYGRYDRANHGIVQQSRHFGKMRPIIFQDDDLTMQSLAQLCEALKITNTPNDPQDFHAIYVKIPCDSAKTVTHVAQGQMPDKRPVYNLEDNHCMSFAIEMAEVAGVDVNAARNAAGYQVTEQDKETVRREVKKLPFSKTQHEFIRQEAMKENTLARFATEAMLRNGLADSYIVALEEAIPKMQPPSLMMLALQKIWTKLNYAPMDFEGFPQYALQRKNH